MVDVNIQALVAAGLSLKKKHVSSLVEKWQKVQKDVSDEISKEQSKKTKKVAHEWLDIVYLQGARKCSDIAVSLGVLSGCGIKTVVQYFSTVCRLVYCLHAIKSQQIY